MRITSDGHRDDDETVIGHVSEGDLSATRPCLETPWASVNEAMDGGDGRGAGLPIPGVVVIAGRPSMGKSSVAEQISIGLERSSHERVCGDNLVRIASVMFCGIERGPYAHAGSLVERSGRKASDLNITMIAPALYDPASITRHATRAMWPNISDVGSTEYDLMVPVLVIDYIQIISGPGRSEKERIDNAMRAFHAWATENDGIVIVVAQMNRGIENAQHKRRVPMMSDLEHSGLLEQLADVIIFPIRDSILDGKASRDEENCTFYIIKNRDGRTAAVPMIWRGPERKFVDR